MIRLMYVLLCALVLSGCISKFTTKTDPLTGQTMRIGVIGTASSGFASGITLQGRRAGRTGVIRIISVGRSFYNQLIVQTDNWRLRLVCTPKGLQTVGPVYAAVSQCPLTAKQVNILGTTKSFSFRAGGIGGPYSRSTGEWLRNLASVFGHD